MAGRGKGNRGRGTGRMTTRGSEKNNDENNEEKFDYEELNDGSGE